MLFVGILLGFLLTYSIFITVAALIISQSAKEYKDKFERLNKDKS
jgi:hypothetical protein